MPSSSNSLMVPLMSSNSLSLLSPGSCTPASSRISVSAMRATCSSWLQSWLLRASREISRLSTMPTSPAAIRAIRSRKPLRSAAEAPDLPWSSSITRMRSSFQPSAIALRRSPYCRCALSVLVSTCLSDDWRTYRQASRARWWGLTFCAAVSSMAPSSFLARAQHAADLPGCLGQHDAGGHRGARPRRGRPGGGPERSGQGKGSGHAVEAQRRVRLTVGPRQPLRAPALVAVSVGESARHGTGSRPFFPAGRAPSRARADAP